MDELTLLDVALLTRSIAGDEELVVNPDIADVNLDGEVNLRDVVLMKRYLAGGYNVELY